MGRNELIEKRTRRETTVEERGEGYGRRDDRYGGLATKKSRNGGYDKCPEGRSLTP